MKKSELLKSIVLAMLILLTIIQTTMLWLGGIPGQSFFKTPVVEQTGIEPYGVWIIRPSASNVSSNASFAYRVDNTIESTRREYERLVAKLQSALRSDQIDYKKVKPLDGIPWEALFAMPTICYEYQVPMTIQEISGGSSDTAKIEGIDMIFMGSKSKFEKDLIIYMVSTKDEKTYRVDVTGDFQEINKIYTVFTREEMLKGVTKYQPSVISNVKKYVEDNTFMPIASTNAPIDYDVLTVYNPIDMTRPSGVKELEKYVNDFFINPLIKNVDYDEDGSVIFTEQKRSLAIYNPAGVIEYLNLAPKPTKSETTRLGGYHIAKTFIQDTDILSPTMKRAVYLSKMAVKGDEINYFFDVSYKGYAVHLSREIKAQMDMESFVEITVKNNEIVSAAICTLRIEPKIVGGEVRKAHLTSQYLDPINAALEILMEEGNKVVAFEDVQSVYLIPHTSGTVYMTQGVQLNEQWYYP
ncbi:MAG: hypothetical protein ACRDDX_08795 [Cellulosilyticaceae bacterium]